jgi:hypothetical protein
MGSSLAPSKEMEVVLALEVQSIRAPAAEVLMVSREKKNCKPRTNRSRAKMFSLALIIKEKKKKKQGGYAVYILNFKKKIR